MTQTLNLNLVLKPGQLTLEDLQLIHGQVVQLTLHEPARADIRASQQVV